MFSCNLLPARDLLRATAVTCGLQLSDVTRGGTDTDIRVSTESWPPRRKFSCRSGRESNPRHFDRESVESQVPVTTQPRWLCNSLRKWLRNNAKTNNQTTWRKNKKEKRKEKEKETGRQRERQTDRQREKGRKNKPEGSGQRWSEHQPNLQSPLFCFKTKLFTKQQMNSGGWKLSRWARDSAQRLSSPGINYTLHKGGTSKSASCVVTLKWVYLVIHSHWHLENELH